MPPSHADLPAIGLAVGYDPSLSVRDMAEQARAAEAHGFGMVFFSETLFTNRDSVSALAAFATATETPLLGTTQVVRLRTPLVMAQSAATLDELSGGRTVLVVGAFTAKHAARNGVEPSDPVTTLNEYVTAMRGLLTGEPTTVRGSVVHMEDVALSWTPVRPDLPIWVAATSRKGIANAAVVGDGLLLDAGASPEYSHNAITLARQAREDAGLDPATLQVAQLVNTSIDDDEDAAVAAMRWEVTSKFTYASTPRVKMAVGEPTIDPDEVERLQQAFAAGGKAALAEAIPRDYVTGLTATGDEATVRAKVEAYRQAGVDLPLVRPAALSQMPRLLAAFGGR